MSSAIEVGQVLSLKIRYNNSGNVSSVAHPYLVVGVNYELNVVEIAQLDSLNGKHLNGGTSRYTQQIRQKR